MAKIGLVLSGGMAKGAYQIGVLKALSEYLPPAEIALTSASSIGVLNAYAFHTGKLEFATELWKLSAMDGSRRIITSMLRSSFLQSAIANLYSPTDTLQSELYLSLYNFSKNHLSYVALSKQPQTQYVDYLRASVSMPLYNRAVVLGQDKFFDGAMIDNIPMLPLVEHKPDYVICVYFDSENYIFENRDFDRRVVKITFPDDRIIATSVFFKPDSVDYMISQGYSYAKELFAKLFANGKDDLPHIYQEIARLNVASAQRPFRITGDIMVRNLNKVTQKLTRRRRIIE